jgi:hypothetical protein
VKLTVNTDTGRKTPEWTYQEVSDEVSRLNLRFDGNRDEQFTEDEIVAAVNKLDEYHLVKNVVTFNGPDFTPAQMSAFAKFAEAIDKNARVTHDYNGFTIKRNTTDEERREAALSRLRSDEADRVRKIAEAELTRRFEAGEFGATYE